MTAPSVQEQLRSSLQQHIPCLSSQLSPSQRQGPSSTQAASTCIGKSKSPVCILKHTGETS